MKVINLNGTQSSRTQKAADAENDARVEDTSTAQGGGATRDFVDLQGPEHLGKLSEIALEAPVDEVEFEELKAAIRSGDYQPDLEGLADRLLGDDAVLEFLSDE